VSAANKKTAGSENSLSQKQPIDERGRALYETNANA
jgi:hypothetical protein